MKKPVKLIIYTLCILCVLTVLMIVWCNVAITSNAKGRMYTDVDSIPEIYGTGLLLGTTPQTRIGNRPNQFFKYRIDATEQLYKGGKICYILISGDENSLDGVNEVECMRDTLIARGIPAKDIYLDGKGFRTLDSVVRASEVVGIKSYIIISQQFHNERALYLADHLGTKMDKVIAFNAKDPTSAMSQMTYIREWFARVKVFIDILLGTKPKSTEQIRYDDVEINKSNSNCSFVIE